MPLLRPLAALLLLAPAALAGCSGHAASGTQLTIHGFAFEPSSLRVQAGATVHVVNRDSALHSVTSGDGGATFDRDVPAGGAVDMTFPTRGTFTFHCKYHGQMTGTITVS